jgi:hypothetical protein
MVERNHLKIEIISRLLVPPITIRSESNLLGTCGSYNNFLVGLTSHFQTLDHNDTDELMEVPDRFLVDTGKVYSTLRRIKVTKSPGPDNIPNKSLKTFAFELAPVVTDIYNASMVQGNFPQQLKRAFVIPIPKYLLQDPSRTIYDQYLLPPRLVK